MASVEHCLPSLVKMAQKSNFGEFRPGVELVRAESGRSHARIWSDYDLLQYDLKFTYLKKSENGLRDLKKFLRSISIAGKFWIKEPLDGDHFDMICGPIGDASRTCFPVPIYSTITDGVYMIDGVLQESSAYTLHSTANLISADTYAVGHAGSVAVTNGADATQNNFGLVASYCAKITPDTGGTCLAFVPGAVNGASVAVGDDYTMIVAVFESKTSPRTFTPSIRWYDSGSSYLSSTTGSAVAATYGEWTIYSVTGTAPASSVYALPAIQEPGVTTDPWFIGAWSIAPDSYDRWHLPSCAPNVIELASAPAADERVTASGAGTRLARVRLDKQSALSWTMIKPGHTTPGRMRLVEAPEF